MDATARSQFAATGRAGGIDRALVRAGMPGVLGGAAGRIAGRLPPAALSHASPAGGGLLAAALGIGGGPVLALFAVPLRGAIGAGAVFNVVVATRATAAFVLAGRPGASLGHVALAPLLLAVPAMVVAAELAARAPVGVLRRLFGLCLFAIAARLLVRIAAG